MPTKLATPVLLSDADDVRTDFDELRAEVAALKSATLSVMQERNDMLREMVRIANDCGPEPAPLSTPVIERPRAPQPPLYGSAASFAETVLGDLPGERTRYDRFNSIMASEQLSPSRPSDVRYAMRLLFREIGSTVSEARTFTEAECAYIDAARLTFSERDLRTATDAIARARPDLATDRYRTPIVPPPAPAPGPDLAKLAEDERARLLALLSETPNGSERTALVSRIAALTPHKPRYGSNASD